MNWIRVDGPEIHVSRSVSVIYVRARVYPTFCGWYTSGSEWMEYCADSYKGVPDYLAWQYVIYIYIYIWYWLRNIYRTLRHRQLIPPSLSLGTYRKIVPVSHCAHILSHWFCFIVRQYDWGASCQTYVDSWKVASDSLAWQYIWCDVGGTDIFKCCRNSIVCSRFMSRIDFPGLWFMAKFLDKMYKVCQTPETCARSRKSTQTLISEGQCVMKWVEPALKNERYQRGWIGDSCLGFHFFRWRMVAIARDHVSMVRHTWHVHWYSPRRAVSTQITLWRATRQRRRRHYATGARETPFSRAAIVVSWVEDSSEKVITI